MLLNWSQIPVTVRAATVAQKRHLHALQLLQHSVIEQMTFEEASNAINFCRNLVSYNAATKASNKIGKKEKDSQQLLLKE